MKRPDFLKGVEPAPVPSAPRLRPVAWYHPPPPPPAIPPVSPPPPAAPPALSVVPAPPPSPPSPPPVAPPAPSAAALPPRRDDPALRLALEALRAQGERLAEQARSDALELGVLIARRILEREISTDLGAVFALIKSAIRRAGEDHVTRVRVHPADAAALSESTRSDFSLGKIELAGDASLERGDVVVETEHHAIDGRLSTRFEEIVKHLNASGV